MEQAAESRGVATRSAPLVVGLAGVALIVAAGVALWASEGAQVFAENAFAAFVACF